MSVISAELSGTHIFHWLGCLAANTMAYMFAHSCKDGLFKKCDTGASSVPPSVRASMKIKWPRMKKDAS